MPADTVVNPISIKRFAQMKLARAKTDKYDAAIIAQFGASQAPDPWQIPDAKIMEMQQLCTLEEALIVQKGMLRNQKEAFSQNPFASKTALKSIEGLVTRLEKRWPRSGLAWMKSPRNTIPEPPRSCALSLAWVSRRHKP